MRDEKQVEMRKRRNEEEKEAIIPTEAIDGRRGQGVITEFVRRGRPRKPPDTCQS